MSDFEFIEHTADIGLRVYGKTREDLFKNAAFALSKLLVDKELAGDKRISVQLEAESFEDLLINWLNELISNFFAHKFLGSEFCLSLKNEDDKKSLQAEVLGSKFDPYKNKINREVKAATYHNLKIVKTNGGFSAEIIFDV